MYVGMAIGQTNFPYVRYHSTDKLLSALNYDTTSMTILEDFSIFDNLKVDGIDGSGTVTLSYLKSHVIKNDSSYITSDDIGRSISVSFLASGPLEAEIADYGSGMFGAYYNFNPMSGVTGYPAYQLVKLESEDIVQFSIVLENKLEEDSFNVSASFVDTGDVIVNSTATFMQEVPGYGYAYLVNLPMFDITSTLDPSDNETFNFSNITYWDEGVPYVILGNPGIINDHLGFNSDNFLVGITREETGDVAVGYFLSANPPYSENFALNDEVIEMGIDHQLGSIWERTGLNEFDIYTALLSDITINEAYIVKSKLNEKYIDIDVTPKIKIKNADPIYINLDRSLGLYFGNGITSVYGSLPDDYNGSNDVKRLEIDYYTASSKLAGAGLTTEGSKLKVNNASATIVGGIKARLDGDTLYITTNGSNP